MGEELRSCWFWPKTAARRALCEKARISFPRIHQQSGHEAYVLTRPDERNTIAS